MTGCLEFGDKFAEELVQTTFGWNRPWINDRQHPRYVRHMTISPNVDRIDGILKKSQPLAFVRRIEV
jgi:hypothetical protein